MRFYLFLLLLLGFGFVSADVEDKATGEVFPSDVSFSYKGKDYSLQATGVATRKKFMFKIYSIASYLQGGLNEGDKFAQIMDPSKAKQLTMKWVRNINASKVQSGFRDAIVKNLGNGDLNSEVETFVNFFGDVKKGDENILRWIPEGVIVVIINGSEKGTIENEAFAKALWNVWFGSKGAVNRNDLISLMN